MVFGHQVVQKLNLKHIYTTIVSFTFDPDNQ